MITYALTVVDYHPPKEDPNIACLTARGNLIQYLGALITMTADITSSKLVCNSVLSTDGV